MAVRFIDFPEICASCVWQILCRPCLASTFEESILLVIVARKVRIRACYSVSTDSSLLQREPLCAEWLTTTVHRWATAGGVIDAPGIGERVGVIQLVEEVTQLAVPQEVVECPSSVVGFGPAVGRCSWRRHRICLSVGISSWKDIRRCVRDVCLSTSC
ncbi:hypothetical protein F511_29936 [Dorcoceras hygrometricum]|uniref:Uncharacterized protein n=1 Tax=Dorcoceras hygrometricum TaxID=472368 RepID=A0A2Z7CTD7_9LAMI|nr:hypothetical protein F511_29936 [Dorcoceras hygrometricum]